MNSKETTLQALGKEITFTSITSCKEYVNENIRNIDESGKVFIEFPKNEYTILSIAEFQKQYK